MTGRTDQFENLENYFNTEKNNLTILYGRNGIGKTYLIKEFVKDKKYLYYDAAQLVSFEQLNQINTCFSEQLVGYRAGGSFEGIFKNVFLADSQINLIIIENFQNLVRVCPDFMEAVSLLVKGLISDRKVMVILTSSSVAWVENSMVKSIGSAAFAINAFMKLKELSYADTVEMFPECDVNTTLCIYAITGGVPGYMALWNPEKSVKNNICSLLLNEEGRLNKETERFIRDEFREIGVYNTILGCLAGGNNKLNEIHEYTGFGRDKISVYIKHLIEREIVEKIFSYDAGGNEYTRKGLYRIKDDFVCFWFRFVYPYMSLLKVLDAEKFYARYIEKKLNVFLLDAFIKVAGEFLDIMNGMKRLPFDAERKGSWYGKNGNIHLIYENSEGKGIIGQAFVGDEGMKLSDYENLVNNASLAGIKAEYFYLFSASGFTEEVRQIEDEKHILIGIDEL